LLVSAILLSVSRDEAAAARWKKWPAFQKNKWPGVYDLSFSFHFCY